MRSILIGFIILLFSVMGIYAQQPQLCDELAKLKPLQTDNPIANTALERALSFLADGKYETADKVLSDAIIQSPSSADLYLYRSCILVEYDDFEGAYRDLIRYLELVEISEYSVTILSSRIPHRETTSIELTETATTEVDDLGGTIGVNYPKGWTTLDVGGAITISNHPIISDANSPIQEMPSGTIIINVSYIPNRLAEYYVEDNEVNVVTILEAFIDITAGSEVVPEFSPIVQSTVDGNPTATTVGESDDVEAMMILIEQDNNYFILLGGTPKGELDSQIELIQAIARSIVFNPPN